MNFERELLFVKKMLDNFSVPLTFFHRDMENTFITPALEWCQLLHPEMENHRVFELLTPLCQPGIIYQTQDELGCNLLLFQIQEGNVPVIICVGPYLLRSVTQGFLWENAIKFPDPDNIFPSLEKYYREIPYLRNENQLLVVLYTLCECLYDRQGIILQKLPKHLPILPLSALNLEHSGLNDSPVSITALEKRYADEEKLIRAVSAGQTDKATILYNRFTTRQMEQRSSSPLRGMKNYFIVFNTLLRKAAEYGRVHPLYIDRLSSQMAKQIEATSSPDALATLGLQMVRSYCHLVRDFSTASHSHLINKLLILVDADLALDLSLSALAQQLNVNSSYLSALFKKEMGSTLTEYVSKRRVSYAMFLLETTNLQIQTIAQQCGIPDENYFTRIFKKYVGVTPKEHRTTPKTV